MDQSNTRNVKIIDGNASHDYVTISRQEYKELFKTKRTVLFERKRRLFVSICLLREQNLPINEYLEASYNDVSDELKRSDKQLQTDKNLL